MLKGGHQTEQVDLDFGLLRFARDVGDTAVGTRPLRAALDLALVQQLGRGLELLMLEQTTDERFTRILFRIFLGRIGPRQQHA